MSAFFLSQLASECIVLFFVGSISDIYLFSYVYFISYCVYFLDMRVLVCVSVPRFTGFLVVFVVEYLL